MTPRQSRSDDPLSQIANGWTSRSFALPKPQPIRTFLPTADRATIIWRWLPRWQPGLGRRMSKHYQSDVADAGTEQEPGLSYGLPRLLLCYLGPPVLAKGLGARGRRYVEAFLWLDLAFLAVNVVVDHGREQGLRRLPGEMGLWPPRQRRIRCPRDEHRRLARPRVLLGPR
mgnify:CR=1 FL=1